jgi:hypothetical protein
VSDAPADRQARRETAGRKSDFFSKQHKVVLSNSGRVDPERIVDYIAEVATSPGESDRRDDTSEVSKR